jgi:actin-related protein
MHLSTGGSSNPMFASKEFRDFLVRKHCYVSQDPKREMKEKVSKRIKLENGKEVVMGPELFRCAEMFFDPTLIELKENLGIHQLIFQAIQKCEIDLRSGLYQHIILSGGCANLPGMVERITSELVNLAPKGVKIKVSPSCEDMQLSAWEGGAIFSSKDIFETMYAHERTRPFKQYFADGSFFFFVHRAIPIEDYEESGAQYVHEKIPNHF